jgi:hypothetical protein
MKTGRFDGEQAEYRQGNFGFAHEWLQEFKTLDEVLERLDALRAADPAHRYLCTLDDVSQCSYTSGHASQDERLYLDSPEDMDWEDPAQEQALTLASLQHRVAQLQRPELVQDWAQVCGTLLWLRRTWMPCCRPTAGPRCCSTRWSMSSVCPCPRRAHDCGPAQRLFQRGLGQLPEPRRHPSSCGAIWLSSSAWAPPGWDLCAPACPMRCWSIG